MRGVGRHSLICILIVSLSIILFAAIAEAAPNNAYKRYDQAPYFDQPPSVHEETSILSLCIPFAVAASVIALWAFAIFLEKRTTTPTKTISSLPL